MAYASLSYKSGLWLKALITSNFSGVGVNLLLWEKNELVKPVATSSHKQNIIFCAITLWPVVKKRRFSALVHQKMNYFAKAVGSPKA